MAMKTALEIIIVISAILVIVSIALQESKTSGLGGLVSGTSETFYSKNKTKTKEAFLIKLTVVSAIVFVISTVLINRILL